MQNTLFKKGFILGIIILFVGVSVLSSVSSKDISIDDNIHQDNSMIKPLDAHRELFAKILIGGDEGIIYTIKESGKGFFFRHVEIWSEVGFDIEGYYLGLIFPKYFRVTVSHVIAPRCWVYFEGNLYPGYWAVYAFAIGNIEWS